MTTKINDKYRTKTKILPIYARERCRSTSNQMLGKQKIFSVSNVEKLFSVRLLNVSMNERKKQQKCEIMHKNQNILYENS